MTRENPLLADDIRGLSQQSGATAPFELVLAQVLAGEDLDFFKNLLGVDKVIFYEPEVSEEPWALTGRAGEVDACAISVVFDKDNDDRLTCDTLSIELRETIDGALDVAEKFLDFGAAKSLMGSSMQLDIRRESEDLPRGAFLVGQTTIPVGVGATATMSGDISGLVAAKQGDNGANLRDPEEHESGRFQLQFTFDQNGGGSPDGISINALSELSSLLPGHENDLSFDEEEVLSGCRYLTQGLRLTEIRLVLEWTTGERPGLLRHDILAANLRLSVTAPGGGPDFPLDIQCLELDVELFAGGELPVEASFVARIITTLAGIPFSVEFKPDEMVARGELVTGDAGIGLNEILTAFGGDWLPPALPSGVALSVRDLTYEVDLNGPASFSASLGLHGEFNATAAGHEVNVVDLFAEVWRSNPDEQPELYFSGSCDILGTKVAAQITHFDGQWQFAGVATDMAFRDVDDNTIPGYSGKDLHRGLETGSGNALPTTLHDVEIRRIGLKLDLPDDLNSAAIAVEVQCVLFVGEVSLDVEFDLHVEHNADVRVSGIIDFVGLRLDFEAQHTGVADLLVANLGAHGEQSVSLRDLVAIVDSDAAKRCSQDMRFQIPTAGFALRRAAEGPTEGLLAVGLGGSINLDKIDLPDLPGLVGGDEQTGGGVKLGLSLAVPVVNGSLEDRKDLIAELQEALSDHGLTVGITPLGSLPILVGGHLEFAGSKQSFFPLAGNAADGQGDEQSPDEPGTETAPGDDIHWLDSRLAVGTIWFERVGLGFASDVDDVTPRVKVVTDASVTIGGLCLSLDGLGLTAALDLTDVQFNLSGLGIDYSNSAVEIGGALLAEGGRYSGSLVARSGEVAIAGGGVFEMISEVPGQPDQASFVAHAVLDYPLGGPAFFFVTGLAAAAGYNRAVRLPDVHEADHFPLVSLATSDRNVAGARDLRALFAAFPPHAGAHFVSAGVAFSSFGLVDSVGVLILRFGERVVFDLVGSSNFQNPPAETGLPAIANIRLLWEAEFAPEEGTLEVSAAVAPGSFILDSAAHLDGEMAFRAWFADQAAAGAPKAGDFVLSIGGYAPTFDPPPHYPRPERLRLRWQVNDNLLLKGESYFALTGAMIMAGGSFEAIWASSDLRASFGLMIDVMVGWQPYHYEARLKLNIHAEAIVRILGEHHISFDARAELEIWGPNLSGTAKIHVTVLGVDFPFSLAFGDSPRMAEALSLPKFIELMLPSAKSALVPEGGLVAKEEPTLHPVFDAGSIRFGLSTEVPFTKLSQNGAAVIGKLAATKALGVGPAGIKAWLSELYVEIVPLVKSDENAEDLVEGEPVNAHFSLTPRQKRLPAAIWGTPNSFTSVGKTFLRPKTPNDPEMVEQANVGLGVELNVDTGQGKETADSTDPDIVVRGQLPIDRTQQISTENLRALLHAERALLLQNLGLAPEISTQQQLEPVD